MKVLQTDTIDSLVEGNIEAAKILSRHGIDFCSEGNRSLKEACAEAGISLKKLLREISEAGHNRDAKQEDPSQISIHDLTLYIENYHHNFTAENIVFIRSSLSRLVRLYGRKYPQLAEIKKVFDDMTGRLTVHMQHEEFIVFPYIRELVKRGKKVRSMYRAANSPIPGMLLDHDKGAEYLKILKSLTQEFSPPADGNAFKITYAAMRELEKDLLEHLALESEVLFPRALEMERQLNASDKKEKGALHPSL